VKVRVVSSCAWLLALALAPRASAFVQLASTQNQGPQAGQPSGANGQGQSNQPSSASNPQGQGQPNQSQTANDANGQGQSNQPSNPSSGQGESQSNGAASQKNAQSSSGFVPIREWQVGSNGMSPGVDWRTTWMYTGQMGNPPQTALFTWVDQASQNSGMTLAPADAALRAHLKLTEDQGLIVTAVEPGSPTAAVGIHQNDVLLRVASHTGLSLPTAKPEDLEAALKAFGESPITIDLLRGGQKVTVKVQPKIHASLGPVRPEPLAYWIGVTVAPVEPALRAQLQIPEKQGLLVTEVDKFGPAARAGVRPFDILRKFDGVDVVDQAGLTKLVQSRADKVVALELLREGKPQEIKVVPQRRQAHASTINLNPAQNDGAVWDLVLNDSVTFLPNISYNASMQFPVVGGLNSIRPDGSGFAHLVPVNPGAEADGGASVEKKIDELSAQIKELRQAIEALAKSQAKK
jgi:hypothetical protein